MYNDAKIKRIVYRRPCHYSSHSKENNIFQNYSNNIYETINGRTINKKNLDINQNYIRSYQIKPNKLLNENYSFQPNLNKNYQANFNTNNNSYQLNNTNNSNNLQGERTSYSKNLGRINNSYHNLNLDNNLNFNKNKILFERNYIPLKDRIKNYSNSIKDKNLDISDNMDNLCIEAFSNLFNLLANNGKNQQIINKNNININNIDNNSVLILSSIIQEINNNELELNCEEFIKKLYSDLTNEDKKFLILNYSNISINNDENKTNLNNKKSIKNRNFETISHYFKSKKNYRLPSGTEKKKNFYYL